eukprot:m.431818 g.431818  ORF g.431818 m.431818 type:complete len:434 (+) comp17351_c0_seq1:1144-2445(+)
MPSRGTRSTRAAAADPAPGRKRRAVADVDAPVNAATKRSRRDTPTAATTVPPPSPKSKRPPGATKAVPPKTAAAESSAKKSKSPKASGKSKAKPGPVIVGAPALGLPEPMDGDGETLGKIEFDPAFSLSQSICSYGYVGLAPNQWLPADEAEPNDDAGEFERPLVFGTPHCEEHCVVVRLRQRGTEIHVDMVGGDKPGTAAEIEQVLGQVRRILRVGWSPNEFWGLHPEAKTRGFGRTFRSPTLWEDMVKTLTNCNMNWKGTCQMNALMCRELGHLGRAFPTPSQVVAASESLQARCRLGYRSGWVAELAQKFCDGEVDAEWWEAASTPTAALQKAIMTHKGFGRFASFNVLQLLGHHESFPFDTETVRLFREEKGFAKAVPSAKVHKAAEQHYRAYAPFQFLAYWFDLWKNYERRAGLPSPRWKRNTCEAVG